MPSFVQWGFSCEVIFHSYTLVCMVSLSKASILVQLAERIFYHLLFPFSCYSSFLLLFPLSCYFSFLNSHPTLDTHNPLDWSSWDLSSSSVLSSLPSQFHASQHFTFFIHCAELLLSANILMKYMIFFLFHRDFLFWIQSFLKVNSAKRRHWNTLRISSKSLVLNGINYSLWVKFNILEVTNVQ